MQPQLIAATPDRHAMTHSRGRPLPPRLLAALSNNTELKDWLEEELEALRRQKQELEAQLVRAQRLANLGAFSNSVVHDFNNLLLAMRVGVESALSELENEHPARTDLEAVRGGLGHAAVLCRQIRLHSDSNPPEVELVNLSKLVAEAAPLLELLVSKNVRLEFELSPDLPEVAGHAVELRQVLFNLVVNAAEALGERGGSVRVHTYRAQRARTPDGSFATLSVRDSGPGMSRETQLRLFEADYSTKGPGRGVGLTTVRRIVDDHRGSIELVSDERGTRFDIRFPGED